MIYIPSINNFLTRNAVWRKIEKNELPRNIGNHGPFILGGDIKLLGDKDSGPKEKEYISYIRSIGTVKSTIPCGTNAFDSRENFFDFLLSHKGPSSRRIL